MSTSNLTYATLLLISGLTCLGVIVLIWQKRHAPGAAALIVMMSGTAIWALTYAVHWIFPNDPTHFFWLDATYLGVAISPTAFFIFALQFNHKDRWLTKHNIWIFTIIPFFTVLLLWTDPFHNLFFAGKRLPTATDIYDGGPWFWVNLIYSYAIILLGYFTMYRGYFHQHGIYRKQSLLIMLGSVIAPLTNIISLLKLSPFPGLDLTPISFTVLGIFYTFGLTRLSMFDILPIAKEIIFNTMQDGIVIMDSSNRLVDLNQTAIIDLGIDPQTAIGKDIENFISHWPEILAAWRSRSPDRTQFQIQTPAGRYLKITIKHFTDNHALINGWLVSWSDITALVLAEQNLQQSNKQLQARLEQIESLQADLQEQVIRDPLTGLFNRRFLEETLQKEVARADRKNYEIVALMIDIDSFKTLNDTFGHAAGDVVLQQLAKTLVQTTRKDDNVIRMGGEEFLILISDLPFEAGWERAEAIRKTVDEMAFKAGSIAHHITISIGIAVYPTNSTFMDAVIQQADEALYRAKAAGRNCVAR